MANELFAVTVRAFYEKKGRIKYISHLDMVRCFSRALKRSGLPVWHTLGFNPHIYMTFALPLPLGYESACESVDFRLTEQLPMQNVADRLNSVFPEGMTVYKVQPVKQKPEAICWADYRVAMEFDGISGEEATKQLEAFLSRPEIPVVKKGKKGERTIDAKPHIKVQSMSACGNRVDLDIRTAAGTSLNINPTLVLDAFAQESGIKADWMQVTRTAILDSSLHDFE